MRATVWIHCNGRRHEVFVWWSYDILLTCLSKKKPTNIFENNLNMNGQRYWMHVIEILWLNNFSKTYHPAKEYIENFKKRGKEKKYRILIYSSLPVFTYSNRTFFVHVNRSIFNVDYELFMIPRVNVYVCT